MSSFTSIPILRLSDARRPDTKPAFLAALRAALLDVGFLYLAETGLPEGLVEAVVRETRRFFEGVPVEEKERIEMRNEKSFLGWSRVSCRFLCLSGFSLCFFGRLVWYFGLEVFSLKFLAAGSRFA